MNLVELQVAEPAEVPNYRNTYELVVSYMHGDADGDTENTFTYSPDEVDDLKINLLLLNGIDDGDYLESQATNILTLAGIADEDGEIATNFADDFYEGDISCDGMGAAMTGFKVFFYDHEGIKHNVNITFK